MGWEGGGSFLLVLLRRIGGDSHERVGEDSDENSA